MKFRLICATRETREQFTAKTALGRSLQLFPFPFIELRLFPENSTGLPKLYNIALKEAESDPAILIFIHDDVQLLDVFWPTHIVQGLDVFDVVGVVGNKRRLPAQPSWCFKDTQWNLDEHDVYLSGIVAHGSSWPATNVSFYGPTFERVKLLDGLLIACRSETLIANKLFFDEDFDFHFYDMDFCRQAEVLNLRLGTWSISTLHASEGQLNQASWRSAYAKYLDKWGS